MKNLDNKKWMTLGAIALVVVIVGALALTLNGSNLQGYLKAPLQAGNNRLTNTSSKLKLKPISAEPIPNINYKINLTSPSDYTEVGPAQNVTFTWNSNVPSGNGYSLNFNCNQNGWPTVSIDSYGFMQNSFGLTPIEAPGLSAALNTSNFYSPYMAATYNETAVDMNKPVYCLWNINSSPQTYIASKQTWHLKINPAQ